MGHKWSTIKEGYTLHYSEYTTIGERDFNEDAFCADLVFGFSSKKFKSLMKKKGIDYDPIKSPSIFGVFDGHRGRKCSSFVAKTLPLVLFQNENFPNDIPKALTETYRETDIMFLTKAKKNNFHDGSTGIVICIYGNKLYVANTGDSRGVMCKGNQTIVLSEDHKPNNPKERERVEKYGGKVKKHGEIYRINGDISVARSFGDLDLKDKETLGEKYLTCEPDITEFDIDEECEFIILACDGLWDVVSNEEAVDFVKSKLKEFEEYRPKNFKDQNQDIYLTSVYLAQLAREKESKDNISCLIVSLRPTKGDPKLDQEDLNNNSEKQESKSEKSKSKSE